MPLLFVTITKTDQMTERIPKHKCELSILDPGFPNCASNRQVLIWHEIDPKCQGKRSFRVLILIIHICQMHQLLFDT